MASQSPAKASKKATSLATTRRTPTLVTSPQTSNLSSARKTPLATRKTHLASNGTSRRPAGTPTSSKSAAGSNGVAGPSRGNHGSGQRVLVSANGRSDTVRTTVGMYLRQRNYSATSTFRRSELRLTQSSRQAAFNMRLNDDLAKVNSFLYSNGMGLSNNPGVVNQQMIKFVDFVHTQSPDIRRELQTLIAPLVCHLFVELLSGKDFRPAHEFLRKFAHHIGPIAEPPHHSAASTPGAPAQNGSPATTNGLDTSSPGLFKPPATHLQPIGFLSDRENRSTSSTAYFRTLVQKLSVCESPEQLNAADETRLFRLSQQELRMHWPTVAALKRYLISDGHVLIMHSVQAWITLDIAGGAGELSATQWLAEVAKARDARRSARAMTKRLATSSAIAALRKRIADRKRTNTLASSAAAAAAKRAIRRMRPKVAARATEARAMGQAAVADGLVQTPMLQTEPAASQMEPEPQATSGDLAELARLASHVKVEKHERPPPTATIAATEVAVKCTPRLLRKRLKAQLRASATGTAAVDKADTLLAQAEELSRLASHVKLEKLEKMEALSPVTQSETTATNSAPGFRPKIKLEPLEADTIPSTTQKVAGFSDPKTAKAKHAKSAARSDVVPKKYRKVVPNGTAATDKKKKVSAAAIAAAAKAKTKAKCLRSDQVVLQQLRWSVMRMRTHERPMNVFSVNNSNQTLTSAAICAHQCHVAGGFDDSAVRLWPLNQSVYGGRKPYSTLADRQCVWSLQRDADEFSDADVDSDWSADTEDEEIGGVRRRLMRLSNGAELECRQSDVMDAQPVDNTFDSGHLTLRGHSSGVTGVLFSRHQPRLLYSVAKDREMRAWLANDGKAAAIYRGHQYAIWCLAESSVGTFLATGSKDLTARLWSSEREFPLQTYVGHTLDVDAVAFHPNGSYLATGSTDATVRLWCVTSGKLVRVFHDSQLPVGCVAFSGNGQLLATGGEETRVRVYDLAAGAQLAELREHSAAVTSLEWSAAGDRLVTGCADGTVRVFDTERFAHPPKVYGRSAASTDATAKENSPKSPNSLLLKPLSVMSSGCTRCVRTWFEPETGLVNCIGGNM